MLDVTEVEKMNKQIKQLNLPQVHVKTLKKQWWLLSEVRAMGAVN